MTLPNFIIVGAMKSGTSTLRDLLTLRQDVFLPPGEVHFFSDEEKYRRGMDWYASLFARAGNAIAIDVFVSSGMRPAHPPASA
jgi:hypothetical protein